jgi:alpha-glucosidase
MDAHAPVSAPATWVLSNHDVTRPVTRYGRADSGFSFAERAHRQTLPLDLELGARRARAAALLCLALPGAAYLYQGEELGLWEVEDIPRDLLQDPMYHRSGGTDPGRDGCRVPLPWEADAPSYGFGPSDRSWLPQPAAWAEYALDRQLGVAGSTWELYRSALALRHQHQLGRGRLRWQDAGDGVLAFRNGDVLVLTNFGAEPVSLPVGARVLLSSERLSDDGRVPGDVTVWAAL